MDALVYMYNVYRFIKLECRSILKCLGQFSIGKFSRHKINVSSCQMSKLMFFLNYRALVNRHYGHMCDYNRNSDNPYSLCVRQLLLHLLHTQFYLCYYVFFLCILILCLLHNINIIISEFHIKKWVVALEDSTIKQVIKIRRKQSICKLIY